MSNEVSHNEIYHKLGVIEGLLVPLKDLDSRVRELEAFKWRVIGIAAVVSIVVAPIASTLARKLVG